ncbi:MAG: lytic transglycosylase domain-containing protein [Magnetovibrio sp.]|nr:lytic transglycosylase domain-containing protein [Magnetovibrio sp.]
MTYALNRLVVLGFLSATCWIVTMAPSWALNRVEIKRLVVETALDNQVPPSLALAVAKVESNFDARALSPAGARGVMQIMPKTAKEDFDVNSDKLWDAQTNVDLGIRFLKQLHNMYGQRWELALSHYNGGTLDGSGQHARPHAYTRRYVDSVMKWQRVYDEQNAVWMALSNHNQATPDRQTESIIQARYAETRPPAPLEIVQWLPEEGDDQGQEWETIYPAPRTRQLAFDRPPPPRHRKPPRIYRGNHRPHFWD